MTNNFTFRLIILGIFLTVHSFCNAQKLHLILVADNRDPQIGNPATVSFTYYERLAQNVAKYTDLQVVTYKIMGDNFSREYITNRINTLSVNERDVIFFYSSTHGWNDGTSEYPMLVLETGAAASNENSVNLKTIYNQLTQKKGRLTIVLGEACNALLSSRPKAGPARTASHPPIEVNAQHIRDLFLRSKLGILACSSRRGQVSVSDREEGGRFTQAFFNIFEKYTSNNFRDGNPSWQRIMGDVKTKTNAISRELGGLEQEPFYEINQFFDAQRTPEVVPKTTVAEKSFNPINKKLIDAPNPKSFVSQNTKAFAPEQTQPSTKGGCFNNTTFQTIRAYHRFVETYWKGIDNADLDDAREAFSTQIFTEDYKELYSNLPQKLGVEHFKNESDELSKLGQNVLDILEETNAQLESDQFKLKVSSKLTLAVTDLNRVIKKIENIKRLCLERE